MQTKVKTVFDLLCIETFFRCADSENQAVDLIHLGNSENSNYLYCIELQIRQNGKKH